MIKRISKKRKEIQDKLDFSKKYNPKEAIKLLKDNSKVNFNETLDIAIKLSIDINKPDQGVRGVVNLPHGTGKQIKVAVIAKDNKAKEAQEAGADVVGDTDLSESIQKGNINFDLLITTPDMMQTVGKLGKILGPKGLMPNPKLGSVTTDVSSAVKNAKSGQVQYKNDKGGIIHAGIGKLKFKEEDLFENLKAFYDTIQKSKPDAVKGSFIKKVSIASTMGFGLELNLGELR